MPKIPSNKMLTHLFLEPEMVRSPNLKGKCNKAKENMFQSQGSASKSCPSTAWHRCPLGFSAVTMYSLLFSFSLSLNTLLSKVTTFSFNNGYCHCQLAAVPLKSAHILDSHDLIWQTSNYCHYLTQCNPNYKNYGKLHLI